MEATALQGWFFCPFLWPTPSPSVGPRPRCFWARTLISLLRSGYAPTNAAVPAPKCPTGTPNSPGYPPLPGCLVSTEQQAASKAHQEQELATSAFQELDDDMDGV